MKRDQEIEALWKEGISPESSQNILMSLDSSAKVDLPHGLKGRILSAQSSSSKIVIPRVFWGLAPLAAMLIAFAILPPRIDVPQATLQSEEQQYAEIALLASEFLGAHLDQNLDAESAEDFMYQDQMS